MKNRGNDAVIVHIPPAVAGKSGLPWGTDDNQKLCDANFKILPVKGYQNKWHSKFHGPNKKLSRFFSAKENHHESF